MTINTREQALRNANEQKRNVPGTCQKVTRGWFNAPSAGDQDGDGDFDAVDGWVSEPVRARHEGDRNPPIGVPLSFSGGSKGYGHRCISNGPSGQARSTDMSNGRYSAGNVGNTSIPQIENSMGVHYLGWSDTIDGWAIPNESGVPVRVPRHTKVARAHRLVERALIRLEAKGKGNSPRAKALRRALKHLPEV